MNNTQEALGRIAEERRRQIEELGYTPESGLQWINGELAEAGAYYALPPGSRASVDAGLYSWTIAVRPTLWPLPAEYFKPGNRLRELSKAGALITAEMERLISIRYDHIVDVLPDGQNWDSYKSCFLEMGEADAWTYPEAIQNTDWDLLRSDYFDKGVSAMEAYESFYHSEE